MKSVYKKTFLCWIEGRNSDQYINRHNYVPCFLDVNVLTSIVIVLTKLVIHRQAWWRYKILLGSAEINQMRPNLNS